LKIQTFSIVIGTSACNAGCPFCVSSMTGYGVLPHNRDIDVRNLRKACRMAQLSGCQTVLFTGKGEPTLYPDEVTEYLREMQPYDFPKIEIQTNALAIGRLARDGKSGCKLTAEDLDWAFLQYDHLRRDLFARFVSDGTEFVRQVNDPQVSRLKQALETKLAREEELLRDDAVKRQAKRGERILGLAREWMGSLSAQQEQEIAKLTMNFPDTLPSWHAHQVYRHQQLLALLEARQSEHTASRLEDWLVHQDEDADPRFAEMTAQLRRHITGLVISLDRSASPTQRRHFLSKLDELAALVRRLEAA